MLLPFLRFHGARLFRAQPIVMPLLAVSCTALIAAVLTFADQRREARQAFVELQRLQESINGMKARAPEVKSESPAAMELPAFDNAGLVQSLNAIAAETQLPLDEVAYVLDENSSEPFLRYRITMRVSGSYRAIRGFSARFTSDLHNVSLDSISCARKDVAVAPLSCDLAFSAFYRRSLHG